MTDEQKRADEPTTDTEGSESAPAGAGEETLRDDVGAYLLDALPESERVAFEAFLARSPETQDELRQLAPVVALLPKLLELETGNERDQIAPAADVRSEILRIARAEIEPPAAPPRRAEPAAPPLPEPARIIRTAAEPSGALGASRAQGRIRSGVAGSRPTSTGSPVSIMTRMPMQWLAAAAFLVVAVGAIIWALALQSRIDSKNREIAAQSSEIAELRQNANASAYTLSAGSDQVPDAGGTLLFSLKDQIGVLYVHDLPELDADRVYQLWYIEEGVEGARPGATFTVDRNGNGTVLVASDTPTYDVIALTEEPEGGSQGPTTAILLQGTLGGVAG